ncbi:MAG: M20 family metallo-hydrolase [Deltaproteobacteria bacterium]|nr:M20 family metallo-hydrolase [Deltaproteobacteria bacterium]MBW1908724.1 M20 family metallo-hydrolase [Deltaproteobacteria bacterium]MBW2033854.1 M20 family metallo-hydrolase [Deltaproteobacteria bacterium]MBW2115243.1 M20 family metallo-hydrolase [Deltaproteobacteria bacterium]MBW2358709.1 M20 family metallo-hydrolase [Deltaproteobacteria bacterium]
MSELENVFERIVGYRDEVIRIQAELTSRVALGPENGGTGEHDKAGYIKRLLERMNPELLEEIKAPDKRAQDGYRPNLIARWGSSQKEATVWVLSHADIVPPGDLSLWKSDPYKIELEGDRIIGRGVEDNQHGFVSSYLALKAVLDSEQRLKRPVGLVVVADEETGSQYGLSYLIKEQQGIFGKQDLIVVPDGGNEEGTMIEVSEKSMLWVKFTVTGKQCHASTPDKGKNSLFGAARLIVALAELKEQFNFLDELFKPSLSTFEPTKMEANVPNVNTIPGRNVFYMDCRILPQYTVDEIIAACKEISARISSELGLQIQVESVYREDAKEPTSPDAPVVKSLARAIKRVTGKDAKPMGIGGGTVAAFFRQAGLPAAVWSTISDTAHQPNEYCLISNILTDAKIFACLYLDES